MAGTVPPKRSLSMAVAALMYLVLLLWKPTLAMHALSSSSDMRSTASTLRPLARSLAMASATTWSLVWLLSISAMSTWYLSSCPVVGSTPSDSLPAQSTGASLSFRSSTVRS